MIFNSFPPVPSFVTVFSVSSGIYSQFRSVLVNSQSRDFGCILMPGQEEIRQNKCVGLYIQAWLIKICEVWNFVCLILLFIYDTCAQQVLNRWASDPCVKPTKGLCKGT